ncbi:MAG TPA: alpha amylase C-terminal domain-containing protein, partial [Chitinophagaceae bacterium]
GAKLLFMGNEFGQTTEWNYKSELNWGLLQFDCHRLLKECVQELNRLLRTEQALHQNQFDEKGFEWVDLDHRAETVIVYKRKGKKRTDDLLIILNMTPVVRNDWEIYVSGKNYKQEIFNSDNTIFWGSGDVYNPEIRCELVDKDQKKFKVTVNLPALSGIILK